MDQATFERERLELFAKYGFEGHSQWLTDRNGQAVYTVQRGDGEGGCPTILIHGGLSEASEWAFTAGKLPGHVVAVDRPGCGLTFPIDYTRHDFRQVAIDYMLDVVEGLGVQQVDLVGNSMGGYFSIVFALAHPERVRRLVLVGAPAGLHKKLPLFIRLWGNPIVGPIISKKGIKDAEALRDQVFKSILVAHPEKVPTDLLETMVDSMSLPGVNKSSYTMLRAGTTLRGIRGHLMIRDDVLRMDAPTLLLWGDRDAFAPPSCGEALAPRMPNASIEVLRDVGHLPHVDTPDIVAARTNDFLRRGGDMPGSDEVVQARAGT